LFICLGRRAEIAETSWHSIRPGSVVGALKLLPAGVDESGVALDQDPVADLVQELHGSDPAVRRIAGKPARPLACKKETKLFKQIIYVVMKIILIEEHISVV
jgi:hypothetical protein